jgi:hypothetical protein
MRHIRLRGTGTEHHVLTSRAALIGVHFSTPPHRGRRALRQRQSARRQFRQRVATLEASAGGGYDFRVGTPEGFHV